MAKVNGKHLRNLRQAAEAARDGSYGPHGKRFGAVTVLSLLDENERLQEELHDLREARRKAAES